MPSRVKFPDKDELKEIIRSLALVAGFFRPRILAPFEPEPRGLSVHGAEIPENYRRGAPSLLVAGLVYGNRRPAEAPPAAGDVLIAPFARRNYYREGVKRLQLLSRELRSRYGGRRSDFRILCNSPVPEKPLAAASGLGFWGRTGLIITPEAGSLFIIAAMTLPFVLEKDGPEKTGTAGERGFDGTGPFPLCAGCDRDNPPCVAACPTGAVTGKGVLALERCIQWYASGKGAAVPPEVKARWGRRLYGCTECQDACIWNRRPVSGVCTGEGPLPASFPAEELLALSDGEIKALFKGSALGLSWLGPESIRRNAGLAGGKERG
ncbi:MAG: iron-sulfur protein [Treponema sp.]|nr:iron-sulfur protein [Treponema sp.]